jgi:hypothetical protein
LTIISRYESFFKALGISNSTEDPPTEAFEDEEAAERVRESVREVLGFLRQREKKRRLRQSEEISISKTSWNVDVVGSIASNENRGGFPRPTVGGVV